MTKEESLALLKEQYRLHVGVRLPQVQEILEQKPQEFDFLTMSAWYSHENIALKCLFIENEISKAKQEFYTCGTLTNYRVLRFGYWDENKPTGMDHPSILIDFMGFTNHITYILLSDSTELIAQFSLLSHKWWKQKLKAGIMLFAAAVQAVLRDDWDGLTELMPYFDKEIKTTKIVAFDKEFFLGIMENNSSRVTNAIETLCSKKYHYHRNKYCTAFDLISFPAAGYAKLAWLKGMQVQTDSPLVPMELMPIAPLEQYVNPYERFWRLGED